MLAHTGEVYISAPNVAKLSNTKEKRFYHAYEVSYWGKSYQCSHCDVAFTDGSCLKSHKRTHTREKPFNCGQCDKNFSRRSYLRTHMRIHKGEKPFQCCHCDKSFGDGSLFRRHVRIHKGVKPYKCIYCWNEFSYPSDLEIAHWKSCKGETFCSLCDKNFVSIRNLKKHKEIHKTLRDK